MNPVEIPMIENSIYLSVKTILVFFSTGNQSDGRLKEKSIFKELLFNQISIDFQFKEVYSWSAISAHAKFFERYDWLRILNLYKDRNDSQSSLSTDIHSIELHTETVFSLKTQSINRLIYFSNCLKIEIFNFQCIYSKTSVRYFPGTG
jgi:hypothetical protein